MLRRFARHPRLRWSALVVGLAAVGCGRDGRRARSPDGPTSQLEADAYVRRAIRSSSEGVILMPSQRAERVYELPRLNEIAQGLRAPAARCFLRRAIETMEQSEGGERGYDHVPEGQAKIRVRIAPSGEVQRAEVLEWGFGDEQMEPCLLEVMEEQRWPPNESGNAHFIDVIYWVSLGMQRDLHTEQMATHLRREQVQAGRRAKACLQGRVDAGRYEIAGLNLIDRDGGTMVNRIDTQELPESIRACLATAFRSIRLPRDPDAFVRPVSPSVAFEIARDGTVTVDGERWLELVELEERARRAAERAELMGDDAEMVDELPRRRPESPVKEGAGLAQGAAAEGEEGGAIELGGSDPEASPPAEPPPQTPTIAPPKGEDPGKGGLRLDLGGPRRGDDA